LRVARGFAAEIELSLGEEPQVVYRLADHPYGPRWEVRNFGFAAIAVDAADGSVVLVDNTSGSRENMQRPVVVKVTEEQARERASSVLALMEVRPEEIAFEKTELWRGDDGTTGRWLAAWQRATGGIRYESDKAYVIIDSATGAVLYATKRWWSAPPEVMDATIRAERAMKIARGLAEEIGVREIGGTKSEAVLKIVQPNHYYPMPGKARRSEYQGATRVAWEVTALIPTTMPGRSVRRAILWIDAASGELLGGYSFRGGGAEGSVSQAEASDAPGVLTSGGAAEEEAGASPTKLAMVGGAAMAVILGVAVLGRRAMASRRKGKREEAGSR